ncbi:MAG: glycosyltransferase family 2 protein [Pyrinomonadaceae bacterium]|nr:glycosyltransferase family 2 protein [Pyrinomonadaceae bacterium]
MSLSLSLVIPSYNEASRLEKTLATVFTYLNEQPSESEVIVVDDGSRDETAAVAEESFRRREHRRVAARVMRLAENRGKGYAVRAGLLATQAPIALFSDADLSTPITETPKLVGPIRAGEYDVVFGSRALNRKLIGVHQSWRREQGGRVFNLAVRLATGLPYWDTQCGFKAFRMDVCRPVIEAASIDRFGFDVELLYVAHAAGLRLREWPVRWDHNEGGTIQYTRDSVRMLNEVRLIRRQARAGFYDAAISRVRALTARREAGAHTPLISVESDASPELLAARRI